MNFGFTEEQELLRAEVRKFLDAELPARRGAQDRGDARGLSRKRSGDRMAELGWLGLTLPEAHGGVGPRLGRPRRRARGDRPQPVPLAVPRDDARRHRDPRAPAATRSRRAGCRGSRTAQRRDARAARGERSCSTPRGVALAGKRDGDGFALHGEKLFVPDAGSADLFVVAFRSGTATRRLARAGRARRGRASRSSDCPTIDETKRTGPRALDDVTRRAGRACSARRGSAWPALARLLDCGALAVTAEMVGAAEAALELTVEYAKERIQFGAPIGRFQGVKHPLAEMYVDVESASRSSTTRRGRSTQRRPRRRARCRGPRPTRARRSRASASTRSSCTARSATPGSTTRSSISSARSGCARVRRRRLPLRARRRARRSVMDFDLTPEEEAFRDEVRAFLDENLPAERARSASSPSGSARCARSAGSASRGRRRSAAAAARSCSR